MPISQAFPDYSVLQWIAVMAFPAALVAAALSDVATLRIPNWLTGSLALAFPLAAAGTGMPLATLGWHLAAGAGALIVAMALFARGWVGGGDAKLFAASLLWLGPGMAGSYALATALLGGGLTIALVTFRRWPLPAGLAVQGWLARLHDPRAGVPYGVALAGAGLIAFAASPWMTRLAG